MADRVSATITLGGTLPSALWAILSAAIAAEALAAEWDGEPFEDAHRIEDEPLRLFAHEVADGTFKQLEPLCQEHRVPFVRSSYGYSGQWGPEKIIFTGEGDPVVYPTSEDGRAYVDREMIEALGSLEAVIDHLAGAEFEVPPLVVIAEAA